MDTISAPGTARTGDCALESGGEPVGEQPTGSRIETENKQLEYTKSVDVRLAPSTPAIPWRVDPAPTVPAPAQAESAPATKPPGDISRAMGRRFDADEWRQTQDTTPPVLRFAQAADGFGLLIKGGIIQDGKVHRCDHRDHPKPGRKSAWYVYFSGGLIDSAVMGDWATGDKQSWSSRSDTELTPAEREEHQRRVDEARRIADAEKRSAQDLAAVKAVREWEAAGPANPEHPYLRQKGVPALGDLRQLGEALVLPMRNAAGEIRSVQTIMPMMDGTFSKDNLKDGEKEGTFLIIPGSTDRVYLTEGYATAASVHLATGCTVLVAWDTKNLPVVAEIARTRCPTAEVVVAGDNDAETATRPHMRGKNPGIEAARDAASRIGARYVVPFIPGSEMVRNVDWNDLAAECGPDEVRRQIAGTVAPEALRQSAAPDSPATQPGPAEKVSRLRRVDMRRLRDATLAPPRFVVDRLIPRRNVTLLGAHGGSGKSSVALVIGAHVAAGRDFAGLAVERGRVLFVSFEDDVELVLWRLRNIAEEYGIPLSELEAGISIIDATEAEAIMIEINDYGVRKLAASFDGANLHRHIREDRFDLVVIDNSSDCYGGNENDRGQVRTFVRYLANSVRPHNGAVLLLAHIDKASAKFGAAKNSYSGSTAWHNSARSRLALIDGELHHEKLNLGKKLEAPIPFAWSERGVPVPSDSGGSLLVRSVVDQADDDALLACFRAAAEAAQDVPASATGPATSWHAITVYRECPDTFRENKARLREGIARLLRAGKIRSESYTNASRKTRERLVLTPLGDRADCASSQLAPNRRNPHPPAPICALGGAGDIGAPEHPQGEPAQPTPALGLVEVLV